MWEEVDRAGVHGLPGGVGDGSVGVVPMIYAETWTRMRRRRRMSADTKLVLVVGWDGMRLGVRLDDGPQNTQKRADLRGDDGPRISQMETDLRGFDTCGGI